MCGARPGRRARDEVGVEGGKYGFGGSEEKPDLQPSVSFGRM